MNKPLLLKVLLLPFPCVGWDLVLPPRQEREKPRIPLSCFLWLILFTPTSRFPFPFIDLKGGHYSLCLLMIVFIPPCLQPLSTFGELHCWDDTQGKVHEHIFQLKKTLKVLICVEDELPLFNNRHQAKWKETGIYIFHISVVPCPMHSPSSCLEPFTGG